MQAEPPESLLEDPAMREATAAVLDRHERVNRPLQWADVSEELSSDQWGRLIQEGVLVSHDAGFTVANPHAVREGLEKDSDHPDDNVMSDDIEAESWAWYDKAAGLVTLGLFAGYWNTGIRDIIASVDNIVLAPVTDVLPFFAVIILLSVVTGLYSTVLQARLKDTETIQAYQERMNELKERREVAKERGDDDALEEIKEEQMEAVGDQLGMFKLQFRPMVYIMLLTIPVFLWLRWKVRAGHLGATETGLVVPLAGAVGWQEPLLGPMTTWIVWYFLCSMVSRQLIQKTLDIQLSPSTSD